MALEKRLEAVPAQLFTANGTIDGLITVADATEYKVKQEVYLSASSLPDLDKIEIKSVISATQMYVGPKGGNIDARIDISVYTVALGAAITANLQNRPNIPEQHIPRAVYEEEPTVAIRVFPVDELGNDYTASNPFPVSAVFDGNVQVGSVRITACDDDPVLGDIHSSVRISDCANDLKINSDGSINVVASSGIVVTPTIVNFPVVAANTEYLYVFPVGTRKFLLRDRAGDAKMRLAYAAGTTGTNYITLNMGCTHEVGDLNTVTGFTIYFQSSKASRIVEILSWV
jgi:hypothetical protein